MGVYERNDNLTFLQSVPGQSQQAAGSGIATKEYLRDANNGNTLDLALAVGALMAPVRYNYQVPGNARFFWSRAGISLRDMGTAQPGEFGAAPALTNGCRVLLRDPMGTTISDFETTELPIVDNGTLDLLSGNVVTYRNSIAGGAASIVTSQWFLERENLAIVVQPEFQVTFEVRDDLTVLESPSVFWISGRLELIP